MNGKFVTSLRKLILEHVDANLKSSNFRYKDY